MVRSLQPLPPQFLFLFKIHEMTKAVAAAVDVVVSQWNPLPPNHCSNSQATTTFAPNATKNTKINIFQ